MQHYEEHCLERRSLLTGRLPLFLFSFDCFSIKLLAWVSFRFTEGATLFKCKGIIFSLAGLESMGGLLGVLLCSGIGVYHVELAELMRCSIMNCYRNMCVMVSHYY